MIVPNLRVRDMARSLDFYRDVLGMRITLTVTADREARFDGSTDGAVFATLEWDGAQLMLQSGSSLAEELPTIFGTGNAPTPAGTVYFRGLHPDRVHGRVAPDSIVKGPEQTWYGMYELYVRDPDGHIICLGAPQGTPEAPAT